MQQRLLENATFFEPLFKKYLLAKHPHHIQTGKPEKVDCFLHGASAYQKALLKATISNKNNILINQVLRLPLLKHTKNNKIVIIKTGSTKLPPQGKVPLQQLRRRSSRQQSRDRSRQLLSQRSPP